MTTKTFLVEGMTCQHCVNAVTAEVSAVSNVSRVHVDLDTGRVSVDSTATLDVESVLNAITAAGYSGQAV